MNIIIINAACYFRNNSLRNYKLTLLGLMSINNLINVLREKAYNNCRETKHWIRHNLQETLYIA